MTTEYVVLSASRRSHLIVPGSKRSDPIGTRTYLFLDDVICQDHKSCRQLGLPETWGDTIPDYEMDPDAVGRADRTGHQGEASATVHQALESLPAVFIVGSPGDLFGPKGMYTNSTEEGQDEDRTASVELIGIRVALIELPLYGSSSVDPFLSRFTLGRVVAPWTWFVTTPTESTLANGRVVDAGASV